MSIPWTGYSRDDQATLMAPYTTDPSLSKKRKKWEMLWHNGPLALVCHLMTKYKLDRNAYLRSFRLSDENTMRDIKTSFAYLVKLEARLLRRSRQGGLGQAGKAAAQSFMDAVAGDGVLTERNDFVFVAIDFESQCGCEAGIKEFGLALLDTRSCMGPSERVDGNGESVVKCLSYAQTRSACRQFQYSTTTKTDGSLLAELITSSLMIPDHDEKIGSGRPRKVIVVGQSLNCDLCNIEQLGLDIGRLGVIGTIDTFNLAHSTFGKSPCLKQITEILDKPQREHSYHTARNNACFVLQAMLAMLVRRQRKAWPNAEHLDWLDHVARKVDTRPQYMDKQTEEDWQDSLGGDCFDVRAGDGPQ